MGTKNEMVSVIMPAYNVEKFIDKAIISVFQQNVCFELIIIDDASTDRTGAIAEQYASVERVRYIRNYANKGVAETRNIGIREAKGDYVAFLDADDWWREGKLQRQLNLIKTKESVLCYTGRELYDEEGGTLGKVINVKASLTYKQLLHGNSIACSSVLMKRDVALEFLMHHDEYHEDYMLWLKCMKKYGNAFGINEPLLCYRLSRNGKSRNRFKSIKMTYGMHRCMGKGILKAAYYTGCHLVNAVIKYY